MKDLIALPIEFILEIIGELILQPLLLMLLESCTPLIILVIKFFCIVFFIIAFFCIISGNGCAIIIGGVILIPAGIIALILWFFT